MKIQKSSLSLIEMARKMASMTLFAMICFFATSALALPIDVKNYNNFYGKENDKQKLHEEAVELESVLISSMIEPMFPNGKESGLYGGGHGSDIFRQMMIDQYARVIAQKNGLGLAENIEKNLQK